MLKKFLPTKHSTDHDHKGEIIGLEETRRKGKQRML